MPRTIAIGDIHGCSTALAKLIELIAPQADDVLVPLGDYVDRGIDSKGVKTARPSLVGRIECSQEIQATILGGTDERQENPGRGHEHAEVSEHRSSDWIMAR